MGRNMRKLGGLVTGAFWEAGKGDWVGLLSPVFCANQGDFCDRGERLGVMEVVYYLEELWGWKG